MARLFNGDTANYLTRAAVVTSPPITLSCWFYRSDDGIATEYALTLASATDGDSLGLVWRGNGADTIAAISFNGGTLVRSEIAEPAMNTWHHGLAVFASSASRTIYLDGNAGTTETTDCPVVLTDTWVGVTNEGSVSNAWNGYLAEAAIWNTDLSAEQATLLAQGMSPRYIAAANLVGYWPICGSSVGSEPDKSGLGNDLTITGSLPGRPHPFSGGCGHATLGSNLRPNAFAPGLAR